MIQEWTLYLGFGSLAGLLSGLFGIGGGIIIVPFLAWWFAARGFAPESIMIMAVATSLATIVVTSLSAAHAHHRRSAVDWRTVRRLAPGILLGAVLGSVIADHQPARGLKLIFTCFLLYVAMRMLLSPKPENPVARTPATGLFALAGTGIGLLSSILGIGGGTLTVPFLVKCRYPIRQAVAISSACGFPIALAGAVSYILLGWTKTTLPPWSLGYVYLPALLGILLTSVPFAPLGARLAHRWPTARLRTLLALVLIAMGGKMLWQAS